MDYIQYLLYFGVYIGAVVLHELIHYLMAKVLGYNPTLDVFGLSVDYWVPEDKLNHIRIISVAPIVAALIIGVLVFTFTTLTLTWALLLLGLVINTSGSDISISRALGHDNWWTNTDAGIKILCGGLVLWGSSAFVNMLFRNATVYGEQLFYFFLADILSISAVAVGFIGIGLYFWNNQSINPAHVEP